MTNKIIVTIRSIIFYAYFPIWTFLVTIFASPFLCTKPKTVGKVGHIWSRGIMIGLQYICNIKYEIRGKENIPNKPFIIASKHQSVWDTAIFLELLECPVYILKQELLKIPLFGNYLVAMDMIPIDRSGRSTALKKMLTDVKDRLEKQHSIIIFPEGTRTSLNEHVEYQPGITFIYKNKDIKAPIIPVALNSGKHWNTSSIIKQPGTIILEFLPPIQKGDDNKKFLQKLQKTIDSKSEDLLDQ